MRLDIAPFAQREEDAAGRCLTLRWEEPRDIHRVLVRFQEQKDVPRPRDVSVLYWRNCWPQHRIKPEDMARGAIGAAGWRPRDDWFNGEWAPADIIRRRRGREISVGFAPLARREFPALADYSVRFRQTMQLRVCLPEGWDRVADIAVLTDTAVRRRAITAELGCGQPSAPVWDGEVEVYNGVLEEAVPVGEDGRRLRLTVGCARPGPLSADHTIITLRCSGFGVSFRPTDLDEGKPIWIPDFGVLVSESRWGLTYAPRLVAELGGVSRYDAIGREPEQSLPRAMAGQPPKDVMHFIVGCEGGRQKFGIAPAGDIFAHVGYVRRVPGADTPRLGWEGGAFALRFGWERWLATGRRIARGYLPVLEQRSSKGSLDVLEEVLAVPLDQSIHAGATAGDATIACLARLTFTNKGSSPLSIRQPVRCLLYPDGCSAGSVSRGVEEPTARERLSVEGDLVWAAGPGRCLRMVIDLQGRGGLAETTEGAQYRLELPAGESHSVVLKIPFIGELSAAEVALLRAKEFDVELAGAIEYWEKRIGAGSEIVTPEQEINDFHRSHLTHILINDDREVGADRLIGRVSSFNYGNFSNETIMQVMELDRRGLHGEARKHLETFLHYQGTVGLPGRFAGKEGVFYGSGGYEQGGYNQHHGWVLWGLAEHYRFTGDRAWLLGIADKLVAGCEWVIREREATKRTDASGRRVLEHGFLPAGGLEDVQEYCYWISTNCLTSRGLTAAAEALAEVGHPEGPRLVREAAAYQEDLLAGLREAMIRSPVVRLRDGAYVPHFPSRLYLRGRDFGWIREVLEGAISLITTVFDPTSREATWILKDYEDNLYLDAPYNYPLQDFERDWFCQGGFSIQPNLVYIPPPHLLRDQIERFLRAFFNGFAACWRPDIRAMAEHELPTLAEWAGDHFKTSDEAQVAMWLRMMFIQEEGDTLYLGRGLPRAWVGSEEGVAVRNAATHFGPMSLEMRASRGGQVVTALVDPPTRRPPRRVVVRFRHPSRARLSAVSVNGRPAETFDADKEWVVLPALCEPATIEARF